MCFACETLPYVYRKREQQNRIWKKLRNKSYWQISISEHFCDYILALINTEICILPMVDLCVPTNLYHLEIKV